MLVTSGCWWQFSGVGDRISILVQDVGDKIGQNRHQHLKVVATSISSPTSVANIDVADSMPWLIGAQSLESNRWTWKKVHRKSFRLTRPLTGHQKISYPQLTAPRSLFQRIQPSSSRLHQMLVSTSNTDFQRRSDIKFGSWIRINMLSIIYRPVKHFLIGLLKVSLYLSNENHFTLPQNSGYRKNIIKNELFGM